MKFESFLDQVEQLTKDKKGNARLTVTFQLSKSNSNDTLREDKQFLYEDSFDIPDFDQDSSDDQIGTMDMTNLTNNFPKEDRFFSIDPPSSLFDVSLEAPSKNKDPKVDETTKASKMIKFTLNTPIKNSFKNNIFNESKINEDKRGRQEHGNFHPKATFDTQKHQEDSSFDSEFLEKLQNQYEKLI
jgi:hypothetical protein